MSKFRLPGICLFLLPVYFIVSVSLVYITKPVSDPAKSAAYVEFEPVGSQPQILTTFVESALTPITHFPPLFILEKLTFDLKNRNSYFLLKVQKTIQFPSCKTLFLLNRVLIH